MTNDEIREEILNYKGEPFLCNEYAVALNISWHRMKRLLNKMVDAGELHTINIYNNWTFYSPTFRG